MNRFGRALAGVAGWILAVCGIVTFLGTAAALRNSPSLGPDAFAVAFFLAVTIGGVALTGFAWPGHFGRVGRGAVGMFTDLARFSNPIVHGLAIYVVAVPFLAVTGNASIMVALLFATIYAVASPVLIALRPRPWLHVPLSIVVGIFLIGLLPGTAEALSHKRFGDDWMVLLGPVMLYPVVLVAALVFRVVWKTRAARMAAAAVSATDDVAQQ